jgi:hypothetical protein
MDPQPFLKEAHMADMQKIVSRYLAAFNEVDSDKRRVLLDGLYGEDSTYTDPHVDLRGPEQIDAFISSTQERFPGFVFQLGGELDTHHNQARFQWHASPAGETDPTYVGFDVIVTEGERVRSVYGFMDAAPAA